MEKRIAGIIRWLERCLAACKAGATESALMDAECARADIDRLRSDLWNSLERKHTIRTRTAFTPTSLRVAFLAFCAVLASAAPLALPQEKRLQEAAKLRESSPLLEWVTPDEKMLLVNLRKRLSDANTAMISANGEQRVSLPKGQAAPAGKAAKEAGDALQDTKKEGISLPYDRIISLVQTGEKALRNEDPVIKIDRR